MTVVCNNERDQLLCQLVAAFTSVQMSLGYKHNELSHLGIGQGGCMVLDFLDRHGPAKMGETAAALRVSSASITGITGNLVRDGRIRRLPAPHDRRVVIVEITDSGRDKLKEVKQLQLQRVGCLLAAASDDDLRGLVELVERLSKTAAVADRAAADNSGYVEGIV